MPILIHDIMEIYQLTEPHELYVCRLWEEVGLTREDSCRHKKNMQTPDRAQPDGGFKPLAVRQALKGILKKLFAAVS